MCGDTVDSAKCLDFSETPRASTLGPVDCPDRSIFLGTVRPSARWLYQPCAALCFHRRRVDSFQGRTTYLVTQPKPSSCRGSDFHRAVLLLGLKDTKCLGSASGMFERRSGDCVDRLATPNHEPLQAARFRAG